VQFAVPSGTGQPNQTGAQGQAPKGAVVRLAQALLEWNNTRSYVGQQVKALQDTILEATSTQPEFAVIKANIGNLETLLETLDDSLTAKLNELRTADEGEPKRRLSNEARDIVAKFQKFTADDPLMNAIDKNGFLPLDIKTRVAASLDEVMKTI
jgi:hypothetical protein